MVMIDSQSQTGASECEEVTIIQSSIIKMTRLPLLSKLTSPGGGHNSQSQSVSEAVTMVHTSDPFTIIECRLQVEKFQKANQGLSIVKSFKVQKFQMVILGLSILKSIRINDRVQYQH